MFEKKAPLSLSLSTEDAFASSQSSTVHGSSQDLQPLVVSMPEDDSGREKEQHIRKDRALSSSESSHSSPPSPLYVAFLVVASIVSSVGLILANKVVIQSYHFDFVLTLSACHFLVTSIFARLAAQAHLFVSRRSAMPFDETVKMALGGTASIVFMNYNLRTNSVGFYQMTKLLCIPWIVLAQRLLYRKKTSIEVLATLLVILGGVGLATVADVQISSLGLLFGVLAVGSTAHFQMWQGSKQAEYQLNPLQIVDAVMPFQLVACTVCIALLESMEWSAAPGTAVKTIWDVQWSMGLLFWIFVTCVLAVAVNIVSYALIGKTSAVTYQVVGHFKTVLTLLGGYLFFDSIPGSSISGSVMGASIALLGMILYGNTKANPPESAKPSLLRNALPGVAWSREL